MSLAPIRQTNKYSKSFQSSINNNSQRQNNITTNQSLYLKEDSFDDGKIGAKKGFKHFVKGIISPIQTLISSPKNLLIGAGTIIGTAALCAAFPPILPAMVAFGVLTGSFQIINGGYKAINAKTDKQAEQAWENIGAGTFAIGTSAIGAKSSLKASGAKNLDNLNIIQATIKCFKEIPNGLTKAYKMAKNGTAFLNLKNTIIKPMNHSDIDDIAKLKKAGYSAEKLDEIKKYSETIHKEGMNSVAPSAAKEKGCIQELINILPEELKDKINYRVKSPSSIKDKLINKLTDTKRNIEIQSLDDARNQISDLIGSNIILDNLDDAHMDLLIDSLAQGLKKGEVKFLEIENYRGEKIKPYLTSDHIDMLREVAKSQNIEFNPYEGFGSWDMANKVKPSGYTTAQINIQYKDGSLGEFQIRGKGVHKLATIEHIPYDLRKSKDLSGGNPLLKKLYKPLEKNVKLLSNNGYNEYNNYLNALYKYYRKSESGIQGLKKPQIKDFIKSKPSKIVQSEKALSKAEIQNIYNNIMKMLDIDNIEHLFNDASWLKEIPKTERRKVILQSTITYLTTENINNNKWSQNNAYTSV